MAGFVVTTVRKNFVAGYGGKFGKCEYDTRIFNILNVIIFERKVL